MKAGFRPSMAWLHSWAGLVIGWLLFAIAITGAASVFKDEISDWMRPEVTARAATVDALAAGFAHLEKTAPHAANWYLYAPDDRSNATIASYDTIGADGQPTYKLEAFDPVTGRPDGIRQTLGGEFFYRFHFELELPYPWGRILSSFAGMVMLVALLTGIVTHRRIFADFFTFRPGKGKRSWLDAHNVLAVLPLPFHLMITLTGVLTLITLTFPWAMAANYGSDTARAFAELAPGYYSRPRADRPAPLGDVRAMLADAERRFDGGRIGSASIDNPGDAGAVLQVTQHDGDQIAYAPRSLAYDAATGRLLSAYTEARPAKKLYDTLYGLHMGRFGAPYVRWLYFLCGLALSATILTGLILWTVSRPRGASFGHRLVERLTIGAAGGLLPAVAAFFLANRLLPVGVADRPDKEVWAFFATWALGIVVGLACRPRPGWIGVFALSAAAWAAIPLVSWWSIGMPGGTIGWGFDIVSILTAAGSLIVLRRLRRGVSGGSA
jgi:uncharacterized iron-regulated membrane protein